LPWKEGVRDAGQQSEHACTSEAGESHEEIRETLRIGYARTSVSPLAVGKEHDSLKGKMSWFTALHEVPDAASPRFRDFGSFEEFRGLKEL
jgi:hypothetical protein